MHQEDPRGDDRTVGKGHRDGEEFPRRAHMLYAGAHPLRAEGDDIAAAHVHFPHLVVVLVGKGRVLREAHD